MFSAAHFTVSGMSYITSNGGSGSLQAGGGSGGSIVFDISGDLELGSAVISANGGAGTAKMNI